MYRREVAAGANDRGHTAQILLWFIFIVSVLTVAARLGTKYALTRKLGPDDYLMLAAQAAYLAQCITVSLSITSGLGKSVHELSDVTVDNFLKADYAGIIFWLVSLTLVKWSISTFTRQLSPSRTHKRLEWALRGVFGLWLLTSAFAWLFQCAPPITWDYIHGSKCVNQHALWSYIAVLNILTDIAIVVLFTMIIAKLQISRAKKTIVLTIFLTRLLVVGVAIAQLYVFLKVFSYSDPTDTLWLPVLLNQAVLAASTITACAPYLKPFMESLESGIIRIESVPGPPEGFQPGRIGTGGYHLSNMSNSVACSSRATS